MNKYIIAIIIILIISIIKYQMDVKSMCNMKTKSWDDIKDGLNTGDIFMTRYDHLFDLNIIKYLFANVLYSYTGGIFTHAAVVIRLNDKPYLYTAMDSPKYDLITKSYKSGSMMIDIDSYLQTYTGNFVLYKIKNPVENLDDFNEFAVANSTKEFDLSPITMMNTIFGFWETKTNNKTMCSQAVADGLKALGVMPQSIYSPNVGPTDILSYVKELGKYGDPIMVNNIYAKNQCSVSK